jgi:phospholipid/cholesterol/gamma-HCH transport system permease protein
MAETEKISLQSTRDGDLIVRLAGAWHLTRELPSALPVQRQLEAQLRPRRIAFDGSAITNWDSGLLVYLREILEVAHARAVPVDLTGLPPGARRLIELAEAVPERKGARADTKRESLLARVGNASLGYGLSLGEFVSFIGELSIAFSRFIRGKARYRRTDLLQLIQACGASALGIVTLISFLVGVILAFMGAVQLQQFGASIYVADLVGIGTVREMGAMMTAIIMAGRTGAAFAAQLGTMKVTEEIDAYRTMGISPLEFLVLPRTLALIVMMPLLCLYADLVGILGGAMIGTTMLDIPLGSYLRETASAITFTMLFGGLFKATFYGVLIAIAGCLRGFKCGNSSSAVGDAATQAVVMGIVMIVTACGIFAVVFNILGIEMTICGKVRSG